tara:strand:- start:37 stop:768 length:732 start_codon:yes stop_codon:yes gene_type:complete
MTKEMPLTHHLDELRKRIIISILTILFLSVIGFLLYTPISTLFIAPFEPGLTNGATMNVNSIYEGFFVKLKLSFLAGIIGSLPMIIYQICRFIIPGLKSGEKKWLFITIVASSLLSIGSTYLGYAIIFPYVVTFLLNSAFIPENINILLNYQQNLSYIISFLLGGIIIFQSPIVLTVCLAKNIITRRFLWHNARWFIVGIITTSAMVTPPDIFSQISISVPLIICYFFCICLAKIMNWGEEKC